MRASHATDRMQIGIFILYIVHFTYIYIQTQIRPFRVSRS